MKRGINDLWLNSLLMILCIMRKVSDQGSRCQDLSFYVSLMPYTSGLPISPGEMPFVVSQDSHLCKSVQRLFSC
jgi:hypothetical protein